MIDWNRWKYCCRGGCHSHNSCCCCHCELNFQLDCSLLAFCIKPSSGQMNNNFFFPMIFEKQIPFHRLSSLFILLLSFIEKQNSLIFDVFLWLNIPLDIARACNALVIRLQYAILLLSTATSWLQDFSFSWLLFCRTSLIRICTP